MNIYVGNLAYSVGEENLRKVFEEYGEVTSVKIITDKFTGKSKGFAFVEMTNKEEGDAAIRELNEASIGNRNIKVNEARPKEEGASAGRSQNRRNRY